VLLAKRTRRLNPKPGQGTLGREPGYMTPLQQSSVLVSTLFTHVLLRNNDQIRYDSTL